MNERRATRRREFGIVTARSRSRRKFYTNKARSGSLFRSLLPIASRSERCFHFTDRLLCGCSPRRRTPPRRRQVNDRRWIGPSGQFSAPLRRGGPLILFLQVKKRFLLLALSLSPSSPSARSRAKGQVDDGALPRRRTPLVTIAPPCFTLLAGDPNARGSHAERAPIGTRLRRSNESRAVFGGECHSTRRGPFNRRRAAWSSFVAVKRVGPDLESVTTGAQEKSSLGVRPRARVASANELAAA